MLYIAFVVACLGLLLLLGCGITALINELWGNRCLITYHRIVRFVDKLTNVGLIFLLVAVALVVLKGLTLVRWC